ncbi:flavin reductase family protein [Salinactinospora qingdaonensis]|uniref:flavin reductase family protein n=1 Tax=Salinactinospora qingdaonensis TaxID=702744 RepID=UPI0031E509A9
MRRSLASFATGVTVVTYAADGEPRGATVNSFTSVSLDPALVLVSFGRTTKAAQLLGDRPFTINVLAATQLSLAMNFAGRPSPNLTVPWSPETAVPRLHGTVAWLECLPWATYDGGDHLIFVGEVVRYDHRRGEPLLFHRGEFRTVGPAIADLPPFAMGHGARDSHWIGYAHRLHHVTEPGLVGP